MKSAVLVSIDSVKEALSGEGYVADRALAIAIFLALQLEKPLLLEGEAGVGKTEVARVLASIRHSRLIRLQGHEGIDVSAAVYEWNYARQIMAIRSAEAGGKAQQVDVFSPEFLMKRPILQALETDSGELPPVLLIDELDRADDEFEAFLLEVLSDFQVSIPEIGTIRAERPPVVIITSNRTRELHEALKRRCLYHWIDYPSFEKECAILEAKASATSSSLRRQVVKFVQEVRKLDLYKAPGTAETLDWARALAALGEADVTVGIARDTMGALLKNQEDMGLVSGVVLTELVGVATRDS